MPDRHSFTPGGNSQSVSHSLAETKLRLFAERREVIAVIVKSLGSGPGENDQESDYASIDHIRDVEYKHREALSRRLRQLDDALERSSAGGYGLCADCGALIGGKRLASDPAVALCVVCQSASESSTAMPTG